MKSLAQSPSPSTSPSPSPSVKSIPLYHIDHNYGFDVTIGIMKNSDANSSDPVVPRWKTISMIADTGNDQFTLLAPSYTSSQDNRYLDGAKIYPFEGATSNCLWLLQDGSSVQFLNADNPESKYLNSCKGAKSNIYFEYDEDFTSPTVAPTHAPTVAPVAGPPTPIAAPIAAPTAVPTAAPTGLSGPMVTLVNSSFSIATKFAAANEKLHEWGASGGDMGMAFGSAVFLSLLSRMGHVPGASNFTYLGVDLNSESEDSSMQIGTSLLPQYTDKISWARQGFNNPNYHFVMLQNMRVCNSMVSLTNPNLATNSVRFIIDTGQVCLQLPANMYSSTVAWLRDEYDRLPSISFQVDSGTSPWYSSYTTIPRGELLYIRLQDLLLPSDQLSDTAPENGAPEVTVNGVSKRLCLLQTDSLFSLVDGEAVSAASATGVLGTLALQSVYFAAEYETRRVGFASKLSSAEVDAIYDNSQCAPPVECIGQQVYDRSLNACIKPACDDYFFVYLDEASQTCLYRLDLYNAGIVILTFCILTEVLSFFVNQYSAIQVMGIECDKYRYSRPLNTQVDSVTYWVGKFLSHTIDSCMALTEPHFAEREEEDD